MRFTRLGALQGDVIWKWISYFQRQSYITVILVVHDSNVSQTTYDLRLVNIKSSSRLEKDITFISRPHLAISLPLKSSLTKHTEILAQRLTLATAFWDIDKS